MTASSLTIREFASHTLKGVTYRSCVWLGGHTWLVAVKGPNGLCVRSGEDFLHAVFNAARAARESE